MKNLRGRNLVKAIMLGGMMLAAPVYGKTTPKIPAATPIVKESITNETEMEIVSDNSSEIVQTEVNLTIEPIVNDAGSVSLDRCLTVATGFNIPLTANAKGLTFTQKETNVVDVRISKDVVVYDLFVEDGLLFVEISHAINPTAVLFEKTEAGTYSYAQSNTMVMPIEKVSEDRYKVALYPFGAVPTNVTHIGIRAHKTMLLNTTVEFVESDTETVIFKLPEV